MALTLLNYFIWDIPDARMPFVFADVVLILGLYMIDRGLVAEKKVRIWEKEHAIQKHESDKAAARAQTDAARQMQKNNGKGKGGHAQKHHNIQQPKKD